MTNGRDVSRRRILGSLLGVAVGSGCIGRTGSDGAGTTERGMGTTTRATTRLPTETTTRTTTESTRTTTETTETATETTTAEPTTTVTRPMSYERLELGNRPTLGTRNVPVTIVYWGDYQCPYCQRFEVETLPEVEEGLIDPGKLRFVYKPVPMFGKKSERAARAAHCAWNQVSGDDREAFWNWQRRVMEAGREDQQGWLTREALVDRADDTDGVSGDELDADLRSGKYGDRVSDDFSEAKYWDFEGTPHFLIFGDDPTDSTAVSGTPSYQWVADTVQFYL